MGDQGALLQQTDHGLEVELVEGQRFVMMPPGSGHQNAVQLFQHLLSDYAGRHGLGQVLRAPAELVVDQQTVLRPDVFVVRSEATAPLLVIEVVSRASARLDRGPKRLCYQRLGVSEYWAVDLDEPMIERWGPSDEVPTVLRDRVAWQPDPQIPPFTVSLPSLAGEAQRDY